MRKNSTDNPIDSETSSFFDEEGEEIGVDFDHFGSDRFHDITPLYVSDKGVIRLFSASRYGKRYVLKALKETYRNDPVCQMVLRKEFEIGITLEHPYIRRTIGFENITELGYVIVLEYVDGETLENALSNGHVNSYNGRLIVSQLAEALDYLHKHQIVHRDIKPVNIMVTYSGSNVKLIDFSLSDSEEFVIIKNPAGSRRYMAPELSESAAKASAKTDIYSFGMTLEGIAAAIKDRKLMNVAKKCCEQDPGKRPASISDIDFPSGKVNKSYSSMLSLDSEILTYVLIVVIVILVGLISFKLWYDG